MKKDVRIHDIHIYTKKDLKSVIYTLLLRMLRERDIYEFHDWVLVYAHLIIGYSTRVPHNRSTFNH